MRLVLAIVSFALAAVLIGFGIAQRTILLGPDHVTAAAETTSSAPVTVIDGATLNSFDQKQTIAVAGEETTFAAYGRTNDVMAWIGDASYNELTFDPESQQLVSTLVEGDEDEVPAPAGSDLWVADFTETSALSFTVDVPENISVIIVADGIEPAPADVSVTWQLDNSTPWATPLVIAGGVLLLLGLLFLLWAIANMRRSRGPRRKQPRLPRVPKPPAYKALTSPKAGSPVTSRGRRTVKMTVVPVLLVGALALGGCTPQDTAPDAEPTPTATEGAEAASENGAPAVTLAQAKRIIARIAGTVEEADTAADATLLATRMVGPALALRTANYAIRAGDPATVAPPAIPSDPVKLVLPQQNDSWPRTVFVVIQDETTETVAPTGLMLVQESAREQYKVTYAVQLEPGAVIPPVASTSLGTNRVAEDTKLFAVTPMDIATQYGDILMQDTASAYYENFRPEGDDLRIAVGLATKQARIAAIPSTASLAFATTPGTGDTIVMATNDAGAIVAVELHESETIAPVATGAAVNAPATVAALIGKTLSTRGITAVYGDQLLFYVPSVDSGGPAILLGYSQGLIAAAEL